MRRILTICLVLMVFLPLSLAPVLGREATAPHLAALINLEKVLQGKKTATIDAGGGVILELTDVDGIMQQNLTIRADGQDLVKLEGGKFIACARLEEGPVTYWAISEFTGGAHCCGQFAFLARAAKGQPVRYLGQTLGYNGGPRDFPGSFLYRQGRLYFKSFDNRFDYFHSSHAECMLVNVPRTYYRLSPTSLSVDNLAFKEVYLKEAAAVDQKIRQQAQRQGRKPEAILRPGFGSGFDSLTFSDNLGQLLVERTILYLYAREDNKAWDTFRQSVQHFYQTTRWVPELQQEITKILGENPY